MADETVRIVHEDGRTGTVPKANLAEAEKLGWHPETAREQQEASADALPVAVAKHAGAGFIGGALAVPKLLTAPGTIPGMAMDALAVQNPLAPLSGRRFIEDLSAVGSHVTGGESEVAGRLARERLLADEAVHPYGSVAGELAGTVAGSAGLGRLAGAAGTGVSEFLGGGRLAQFGGALAGSALEGAGLGADAASEAAWVRNEQVTAEQTLSSMGLGALFGAGTSALFAGASAGLPKLAGLLGRRTATEGLEETAARLGADAAAEAGPGSKEAFLQSGLEGVDVKGSMPFREDSFAHLRAGKPVYGGPPRMSVDPDGEVSIIDGRHRITLAREAGDEHVNAIVYGYGPEGPAADPIWEYEGPVPLRRRNPEQAVVASAEDAPAPALESAASTKTGSKARAWLNDMGDEAIVDALARGNQRALKDLGGGEAPSDALKRETGALIHELGIGGVGRSETSMLEQAEQRVSEMGDRIGKAVQAADRRVIEEEGGSFMPKSIETLFPKIEELKDKLAAGGMLAEDRAIPAWLEDQTQYLRDKAATGELLPSELQKFRIEVDQRLSKWTRAEPGPKADAARELRRVLESHLEEEIAKAGPDLARDYQRAKELYGAARWARDTLSERVEVRSGANRLLSPSDYGTAMATLVASHGNPLIAGLTAVGHKLVRERALSTLAVLAKKAANDAVDVAAAPAAAVSTARNVQTLVAHNEQTIGGAIGSFLGRAAEVSATPARGRLSTAAALRSTNLADAQAAYRDHAREVQTVASVPEVAASRLAGMTGTSLPTVAPGLHAQMAAVAGRAAGYLSANLPAPATDPDSITPQLATPPPISAVDLHHYADRVEGVEHPLSLLEDLNRGRVSPEKVDAVKTVWPNVFERMRATVFAALSEQKTPVPQHQRVLLDLALDANGTIESSLRPASLAIMKAANDAAVQSSKQPPPSGKVPHIAGMFASRTSQIAAPKGM